MASVEYEMSEMEVLEIKVEPIFDEEQNALLDIKLMENEDKTIISPSTTVKALSLCKGASHAAHRSVVAEEEQENNCGEVTGKTENTIVKVKTEPPGDLQDVEAVLEFSDSDDDLDSSKDEILRVEIENELQEELHQLDSELEYTFVDKANYSKQVNEYKVYPETSMNNHCGRQFPGCSRTHKTTILFLLSMYPLMYI
ncbi:uncharacterized protein LOC106467023 [Limulus polyphemus]|uniref:Uncharacterized protein LOC106467023 n=1 Tax=Limulus polyphemus TaxID=6850 RepID=A0ABM1T4L9_LIMPO|nr:uncharacterized protein LOC106467023 [Limulus polyphemus]